MKKLIFNCLPWFLISSTALAGIANAEMETEYPTPDTSAEEQLQEYNEEETASSEVRPSQDERSIEAFDLVSSAYQGKYKEQGIPGYGLFITSYHSGEVTAERLIEAGIESRELSPQAKENEGYINAVKLQLRSLINR